MDGSLLRNSYSPDYASRLRDMRRHLEKRVAVCLCELIVRFAVNKRDAARTLNDLMKSGTFSIAAASLRTEPVYIRIAKPADCTRLANEAIAATQDIEFAVSVLETIAPGYKRGTPVADQGEAGRHL